MSCAQRHSKVSESDGCPSGYACRMGETVSAQRHSKVSESDGCPSGYAGRMGETVSAQRHSKVSGSAVQNGLGVVVVRPGLGCPE
jgi:hypothetical protein